MASRRANSWASGSSSNNKIVGNSNICCNCGKEALIVTVKYGPNLGIKFYGCPLWLDKQCEFFRRVNEHTDMEEHQLIIVREGYCYM
ncbi:DNA topoisomerase 3-alpha [Bienertia sinuspersici]